MRSSSILHLRVILCTLALTACADPDRASEAVLADERARKCVREHPTSERESVRAHARASAECLESNESCETAAACRDECEWKALIGQEVAACIARAADFSNGIGEVTARIAYSDRLQRPTWSFRNTLVSDRATGESSGAIINIDASSGAVLEEVGWQAQP